MPIKYKHVSIDRTDGPGAPESGFHNVGAGGMLLSEIKDKSKISEVALNKMATSIPTPFARLYLYDTAFAELNALESANPKTAYRSNAGNASMYHHLVAECLDMLEFVFEYGADDKFTIHEWDVYKDTEILGATDTDSDTLEGPDYVGEEKSKDPIEKKHKKLSLALREAVLNTNLRNTQKIFIFKWNGEIVGGTSPFTLVYTSPNWRRKMRSNHLEFHGGLGNKLFSLVDENTKVFSLGERSDEFRQYVFSIASMNAKIFALSSEEGGTLCNLYRYIQNVKNNYETDGVRKTKALKKFEDALASGLDAFIEKEFVALKESSTPDIKDDKRIISEKVQAQGVTFFTRKKKPDTQSSYRIKPTVQTLLVEKKSGGEEVNISESLPLVLSSSRLPGNAKYWHRTPYNPATLPARPKGNYFERTLPGVAGSPVYPYLTESDFLEDSIMWLGYKIDKSRFFTGYAGDSGFLLPLKPTFFKFFTVNDLERMVKVTPEPFPLSPRVTVTLDIPVEGGNIRFSRTYEKAKDGEYVKFDGPGCYFKLGVFPFYTYADSEDAGEEDIYKVLLARKGDMELEFYNKDFVNPLGSDVVSRQLRSGNDANSDQTVYYTVGTPMDPQTGGKAGTFTAIRVVKDGIGGMIIPRFKKAETSDDKYVFCIDFGTSNTHAAYAKTRFSSAGSVNEVILSDIHTLNFNRQSMHMAMLNEDNSHGSAADLESNILSEFVPQTIGNGGDAKFPTRTVACTRKNCMSVQNPKLFGDINMAFYTDKYGNSGDYAYVSELKWSNANRKITDALFQELMWMCKNKVAELGGDPKFEFYFTYPQTMSGINNMARGWRDAALAVRTEAHVVDSQVTTAAGSRLRVYEGIAPWYRAVSDPSLQVFSHEKFLNIDIGGGSTDAIYISRPFNAGNGRLVDGRSLSAKFAADDLWGDGPDGKGFTNGFLRFFESAVMSNLPENLSRNYENYKNGVLRSQDLVGFLFSHPEYGFANHLMQEPKLRIPMFVHFAATVYWIARCLAMDEQALPKQISFSGMGSKYIEFLSTDPDEISALIRAIFKYVGIKVSDKDGREKPLNVNFTANPKKVTAEGGVLIFNSTQTGLNTRVVESKELDYHLYDGEDEQENRPQINVGTVPEYSAATIKEVENFIGLFKDNAFRQALLRIDPNNFPRFDVEEFLRNVREGFDMAYNNQYINAPADTPVNDVFFFWPLKHALYMLAGDISKSVLDQGVNTQQH